MVVTVFFIQVNIVVSMLLLLSCGIISTCKEAAIAN